MHGHRSFDGTLNPGGEVLETKSLSQSNRYWHSAAFSIALIALQVLCATPAHAEELASRPIGPRLRSETGSIIILTAFMLIVLMGFVGLALDVGSHYNHKRVLQTAADAGAFQGGHELHRGKMSLITSSARTGTAENGDTNGTDGVVVEVYHPPVTGYYVGDPAAVEVVISQPSPVTFMRMFGFTPPTIPARAVTWAGANSRNCIHVLEETDQDAFWYNSSAILNSPDCALIVNSTNDPYSGHLTSNSNVWVGDATFAGGYETESNSYLGTSSGYGPYTGSPLAPDPFCPSAEGCLEPPFGGAPYECGIDPVTLDPLIDVELDFPVLEYGPITLWPGVYCGKFTLKNSTHVILDPGLYIMQGGPMSIEGDSILEGSEVTFFLTESPTYPFLPMSFQSSSSAILSASTNPADPYYGILFYQDPAAGDPWDEHRFESNSVFALSGAIYFPTQVLRVESSTVINAEYLLIVVRQFIGDSNSVINIGTNYPGGGGGISPLKRLVLVE